MFWLIPNILHAAIYSKKNFEKSCQVIEIIEVYPLVTCRNY